MFAAINAFLTGGPNSTYAGSFNGSNQYLSAPDNAAFELGSNDFTIEAWIYITSGGTGTIIGKELNVNDDVFFFSLNASSQVAISLSSNGITYQLSLIGSTALANNTWYHVATTRIGSSTNNVKLYVNGVQDGTGTFSGSVLSSTSALSIGYRTVTAPQYFTGSISNVRLVNGTGVYTANFIPPTAPLTAVSGTSLLTLQNATIVDNSTNAFTITNTGTVVTSIQYPFAL
jgi:hypothetical protein